MAILNYLIDKTTLSRAGDNLSGLTLSAVAHSLPSQPELVLNVGRSYQAIGHIPAVGLLGLGGNGSQSTIGYYISSTGSCPTILHDVYAWIFHSIIR